MPVTCLVETAAGDGRGAHQRGADVPSATRYAARVVRCRSIVYVALAACGTDGGGFTIEPVPVGGCDGRITTFVPEPGDHVAPGTALTWPTNPPVSGNHFNAWVAWNRHYEELDRGYWVHNAEHGGVILLYNCPQGCPEVVASLLDVVRSSRVDPKCEAPVRNRLIVAADRLLPADVQVAAVGWSVHYQASCFDPYVAQFARDRQGQGPEDTCAAGIPLVGTPIN